MQKKTTVCAGMVKRILKHYDRAMRMGYGKRGGWYYQAHTEMENMRGGVASYIAAGVISALSPGCPWDRNLTDARRMLGGDNGCGFTTYGPNVLKAQLIMQAGSRAEVERILAPKPHITGQKTLRFFWMILEPWRRDVVVVDRHAATLAGAVLGTDYRYRCAEAAWLKAAERAKVQAGFLQAITWCYWREV